MKSAGVSRALRTLLIAALFLPPRAAYADPYIVVNPPSTVEGTGGISFITFNIIVAGATTLPLSFDYRTEDNLAKAPDDYRTTEGRLTILPGQNGKIVVPIVTDALPESTESFLLILSNPENVTILTPRVAGLIIDDDLPGAPKILIPDSRVRRGLTGSRLLNFVISLSKAYSMPVTVRATTADLTARAGIDYTTKTQLLTFAPGETNQVFAITIFGTPTPQGDKVLLVKLTEASVPLDKQTAAGILIYGDSPIISLSAPADGAVFHEPASFTITAVATDPDFPIEKVEFYEGSQLLNTDSLAPYTYMATGFTIGNYVLTAIATNTNRHATTSLPIRISVDFSGNAVPTAQLTAPAPGATFTAPATVNISANAADSDGTISKVEFYQGTTKIGEDTTSPYSFSWVGVAAGSYNLTAKARDNTGAAGTSGVVSITVNAPANIPPTAVITAPSNGASYVSPATVNISANATDSDGTITKVEFFQGGTKIGEDTSSPYSFSWTNVTPGAYNLTIKSTDNSGASTTSSGIAIVVNAPANIPPTVTLTSPTNNAVYDPPATILFTATAADSDGSISKVEFYQGTTKLGEDSSAPYTYSWVNPAAGNYALTARAIDNNSAITISSAIAVTVNAPPNALPTATLTMPANNAEFSAPATINLSANASDSDGSVSKVEFFQGATKLGEDISAPYGFSWTNVAAGHYSLSARATDNDGAIFTSSIVNVTVNEPAVNILPTISFLTPESGAVYAAPAEILIGASADDIDGTITNVQFFANNLKLGDDMQAPYLFTWTNVPAGNYILKAQATDNNGASITTTPIMVTVQAAQGPGDNPSGQAGILPAGLFRPKDGPLKIPMTIVGHVIAYTATGQRVKSWNVTVGEILQWDGRNEDGSAAASGTYLFKFDNGSSFRVVLVR